MSQAFIDWVVANPILAALCGTLFTWALTALGSALVFPFANVSKKVFNGLLGFSAGVMIAASFWSLLNPAIELANNNGQNAVLQAAFGFLSGGAFILLIDKYLPHMHVMTKHEEGVKSSWHRSILLVLAITLHNIPEGLAVGVLFGAASLGMDGATIAGAVALAIGIGIQNFPEGFAVAMPLRRLGVSRRKSFWYGQLSAIVEPIFGVLGALAVIYMQPILPFALAFAAGAMIYVVVEEVIPETQRDKFTDIAVLGFIGGFLIMMILDVSLSDIQI